MRKAIVLVSLLSLFILLLGFQNAEAGPYKGKNFPSDQQIAKTFTAPGWYRGTIGKYKDPQGIYHYFVKGGDKIYEWKVFQLDNGIWLMTGKEGYSDIIEE